MVHAFQHQDRLSALGASALFMSLPKLVEGNEGDGARRAAGAGGRGPQSTI